MTSSPADLMRRNLLDVFNEPDPASRAAAIAETYTEDVVWHEPDRIVHGRTDLERRAEELRAENPDWVFRPVGPVSELDDIGQRSPSGISGVVLDAAHPRSNRRHPGASGGQRSQPEMVAGVAGGRQRRRPRGVLRPSR